MTKLLRKIKLFIRRVNHHSTFAQNVLLLEKVPLERYYSSRDRQYPIRESEKKPFTDNSGRQYFTGTEI